MSSNSNEYESTDDTFDDISSNFQTNSITTQNGRKKKRKVTSSWVWIYFEKPSNNNNNNITCMVKDQNNDSCLARYSSSTGTSTLARHLQKIHKVFNSDVNQTKLSSSNNINDSKPIIKLDDETKENILKQLVSYIICNKEPFNLVENDKFISFCKSLNKNYEIPSRSTLVRAISDDYNINYSKFQEYIQNESKKVSITCDGWSSCTNRQYFVTTIHWINNDWCMKNSILDFRYFPPPHDAISTYEILISIIEEFKLQNKLISITSDSGSEMAPAINNVKQKLIETYKANIPNEFHIRCVCHIINRSVVDATKFISIEVEKLRTLLKIIRNTSKLRNEFKKLSISLGISNGSEPPNLDTEIRWNSLFLMINNSYKYKLVFEAMNNNIEINKKISSYKITNDEWEKMNLISTFLNKAYELTTIASGKEYPTISIQPLIYTSLVQHCNYTITENKNDNLTLAAKAMLEKIEKYKEDLNSNVAKIALVLDPRSSSSCLSSITMKNSIRNLLIENYNYNSNDISLSSSITDNEKKYSFFSAFSNLDESDGDEIDNFYGFTKIPDKNCIDPVIWWKSIGSIRFPYLACLARDIFSIMGSSVPSESVFSEAGNLITQERNRLNDDHIEMSMKLKSWHQLFDNS